MRTSLASRRAVDASHSASPRAGSAAGNCFLPPADVAAAARGLGIAGLMTWDAGWDMQAGWEFAAAVAAA